MKVYVLQPDPHDAAIDSIFVDPQLASRRADALGLEVEEFEVSDSLPDVMARGLSHFEISLFRDGTVFRRPRKTHAFFSNETPRDESRVWPDGTFLMQLWAVDEAEALTRAQAEMRRLVETGEWVCNVPHPSWYVPRAKEDR